VAAVAVRVLVQVLLRVAGPDKEALALIEEALRDAGAEFARTDTTTRPNG